MSFVQIDHPYIEDNQITAKKANDAVLAQNQPDSIMTLLSSFLELPPTLHVELQFRRVVEFYHDQITKRRELAAQPTTAYYLARMIKAAQQMIGWDVHGKRQTWDFHGCTYFIRQFLKVWQNLHIVANLFVGQSCSNTSNVTYTGRRSVS